MIVGIISKQKPSLGIIGGFGPDTSSKFQLNIIHRFQKRFDRQPKIVLVNAPVSRLAEQLAVNGNPNMLREFLIDSIKTLCNAAVSVIVLPCNTAHIFISDLRKISTVPIISIIKETTKFISGRFSKIGLLATSSTIKFGLFQRELSKAKISLMLPSTSQQKNIDKSIQSILDNDKSNKQINCNLNAIVRAFENRGAEAILLACTDLQFIDFGATNIPIIDTLRILEDTSFKILQKI